MAREPTTLGSETEALDALKKKVNDTTCPILDLAQAVLAFRKHVQISFSELARKLGNPNLRPHLSRLETLAELTDTQDLEGKVLTEWELRDYLERRSKSESSTPLHSSNNENNGVSSTSTGTSTEKPSHSPQPVETSTGIAALIRDTVDGFILTFLPWVKESRIGRVLERWLVLLWPRNWVRTLLGFLALSLTAYGGWTLGGDIQKNWPKLKGMSAVLDTLPSLSAPQLTDHRILAGNRLELHWIPPPACASQPCTYRIYWTDSSGRSIDRLGDVATPGAVIEAAHVLRPKGLVFVKAILPDNTETGASKEFPYVTTPVNKQDEVDPLPIKGTSLPAMASDPPSPSPRHAVTRPATHQAGPVTSPTPLSPPSEVHAEVRTPDLIRLSWRAVSKEARYNVYSSGSRTLTALRKENQSPLKSNMVDWTPETGLARYWIVVTSQDADGRESAYSEAIEVVRHPEKSGPHASDEAAGILRKILPW